MKLHAPDLSRNNGPQNGRDGFHTVPNQALFAAHSNSSRRGNEADNGHPVPEKSASSRRRLRGDAPLRLHPRTRWNASLPVIVLALLFVAMAMPAFSRTIYVSRSGNDAGAGTSASPYRTVTRANLAAAAGDVIRIGKGYYPDHLVTSKRVTFAIWDGVVTVGTGIPSVSAGESQLRPICESNIGLPLVNQPVYPGAGVGGAAAAVRVEDHLPLRLTGVSALAKSKWTGVSRTQTEPRAAYGVSSAAPATSSSPTHVTLELWAVSMVWGVMSSALRHKMEPTSFRMM